MKDDPARALVVVSERPHPWGLLRDWLDSSMVEVSWCQPDEPIRAVPWAVAGEGVAIAEELPWTSLVWWVGPPSTRVKGAQVVSDWRQIRQAITVGLQAEIRGVRLAPGCGLMLPDGTYLPRQSALEALIAAYPGGLTCPDRPGTEQRRLQAVLRRNQIPFRVVREGSLLRLST
jgi:hypothetical protein